MERKDENWETVKTEGMSTIYNINTKMQQRKNDTATIENRKSDRIYYSRIQRRCDGTVM
jgi:hypothetical protein